MKRSMKRCKMRKGNGMLLREYLKEWTKEDLLNEARSYELKNCSRLKKDDLIDRIVEYLTTKEALRGRLSCLTKEQMVLFRKACTEPQKISAEEIMDGMQLYTYLEVLRKWVTALLSLKRLHRVLAGLTMRHSGRFRAKKAG